MHHSAKNNPLEVKVRNTYPYPIAFRYGRIVRETEDLLKFDQILRCAEVIDRYLAVLVLASVAARPESEVDFEVPKQFLEFTGNLAWGHFQRIVQATRNIPVDHPLKACLKAAHTDRVNANLMKLCHLRNQIGHSLDGLRRHAHLYSQSKPDELLEQVLEDIEPICSLPLFMAVNERPKEGHPFATTYLLMDETGDPLPDYVEIDKPFQKDGLYLSLPFGTLSLHPMLRWDPRARHTAHGFEFIDKIAPNNKPILKYAPLSDFHAISDIPALDDMTRLLRGTTVSIEIVHPVANQHGFMFWFGQSAERTSPLKRMRSEKWNEETFSQAFSGIHGHSAWNPVNEILAWVKSKGENHSRFIFSNADERALMGLIVYDSSAGYGYETPSFCRSNEYHYDVPKVNWIAEDTAIELRNQADSTESEPYEFEHWQLYTLTPQIVFSIAGKLMLCVDNLTDPETYTTNSLWIRDEHLRNELLKRLQALGISKDDAEQHRIIFPISMLSGGKATEFIELLDWCFEAERNWLDAQPPALHIEAIL